MVSLQSVRRLLALLLCATFLTWGSVTPLASAAVLTRMAHAYPVVLVTAQDGWAFNADGVLRTTDGGRLWHLVLTGSDAPSEPSTNQFSTEGASTLWALSLTSTHAGRSLRWIVVHTADSGRHWAVEPWTGAYPLSITAWNSRDAWVVGATRSARPRLVVYRTTDGGRTWSHTPMSKSGLPRPRGRLMGAAVSFSTPADGVLYAVDNHGNPLIYWTHDGGRLWHKAAITYPRVGRSALLNISRVQLFFGTPRGLLVVTGAGGGGSLYETGDRGRTWTLVGKTPGDAVSFLNASTGWALGGVAHGETITYHLYRTTNGGGTWEPLQARPPLGWTGFGFVTPAIGILVIPGNFLETHNGGETWTFENPLVVHPAPAG